MKYRKRLQQGIVKHYVKMPGEIFNLNLPVDAIVLFVYLLLCSENFHPSLMYLSKVLKKSKNTIRKNLNILETCNIIYKIEQGNARKVTKYGFREVKDWQSLPRT